MADRKTDKHTSRSDDSGSVASRLSALKAAAGPDVVGDVSAKLSGSMDALRSGTTPDALKDMALAHGGEHAQKAMLGLDQAKALANGNIDLAQIAATAQGMGVDGKTKEFFEHLSKNADPSAAGDVPGMVYDKDNGTVKFLGLIDVPPQFAAIGASVYTLFLNAANGTVWDHGYKWGAGGAAQLNLSALSQQRAGLALASLGILGLTHWQDISQFIQSEQKYHEDYTRIARQIAPLLDEMKGGHGAAALMSVKQEENEVIYNERRRMHQLNGAERVKHLVQASGRGVQFIISAMEGYKRTGAQGFDAAIISGASKQAQDGFDKYLERYKETYDHIKSKAGEMSKERIEELVRQRMGETPRSADAHGTEAMSSNLVAGGTMLATFAAQTVGNAMFSQAMSKIQPVSAYDMILELKKQLDDDPKMDRYSLPKGMHLDGKKGVDANTLTLSDYIVQVFQQHERDCDPTNKIGKRLQDKLKAVADKIADTLRSGDLDGMALIKLVGERKIVKQEGKSICTDEMLEHQLDYMKAKMRHLTFVDEKEYFSDANFSRKQLKDSWAAMKDDERNVFMNFVPLEVLEAAGISGPDLKARRDARTKQLNDDYNKVISAFMGMGDEKLLQLEATPGEVEMLHKAQDAMKDEGKEAIKDYLPGPGNKDATVDRPLVNLLVHHIQHGGKMSELIARGVAE